LESGIGAQWVPDQIEPLNASVSESLLHLDVPKPAFDRVQRFVIVILKAAGGERRIFIEHVLYPKGNGGVIQPRAPPTGVILSCGSRHDIFLITVAHLDILSSIFIANSLFTCSLRKICAALQKIWRQRCFSVHGLPGFRL
jgi:hypothetical protein